MSFRNEDNFDAESYVRVNTRLGEFWRKYPEGRIQTSYEILNGALVMVAELYRDAESTFPAATGHAFLERLDGDKVGEYTETVAVGRALALLGFQVEKSIASAEEMDRFSKRQETKKEEAPARQSKIRRSESAKTEPAKTETKTEEPAKQEPAKAEPPKQEAKAAEPAKEVSSTPDMPKTLRTQRIFKPLPRQVANGGASNG